ncbi:serine/threonine-protein kinase, partial [Reticulomyxa filosa]
IDIERIGKESELKKLEREIEMLKNLNHPRILKIRDFWSNPRTRQVCFITDIIQSGSLRRFIREREVNLASVKKWCRQMLAALDYLHTLKPYPVIHRDIKCDNIFIDGPTGYITIGDLGLSTTFRRFSNASGGIGGDSDVEANRITLHRSQARDVQTNHDTNNDHAHHNRSQSHSHNHDHNHNHNHNNNRHPFNSLFVSTTDNCKKALSVVGTAEFMAPELYTEKYNEKVDIYAFGMCVVEMITRKYPYTVEKKAKQTNKKDGHKNL